MVGRVTHTPRTGPATLPTAECTSPEFSWPEQLKFLWISGPGRKILSPAAAENFQPKSTGTLEISSPTFFLENIFDDTHTHLGHLTAPCRPQNQVVPAFSGSFTHRLITQ